MKLAIVGSRNLEINDLKKYIPKDITEIVSGGAKGIDTCARAYALKNGIKLTEFLPDYKSYGRAAPLNRNLEIIDYADEILAFWDGKSNGTKFVINAAKKQNKKVTVVLKPLPKAL